MSYINDALKKARDGKSSRYEIYSDIIVPPGDGRQSGPKRKWIFGIAALLILLVFSGAAVYYYQYNEEGNPPAQVSRLRPAAPPSAPVPLPVQPSVQAPQAVRPSPPSRPGSSLKEETLPPPPLPPPQFARQDAQPPLPLRSGSSLKEETRTSAHLSPPQSAEQDARPQRPLPAKPPVQAEKMAPASLVQQKQESEKKDVRPSAPLPAQTQTKEQAARKTEKPGGAEAKTKAEKYYQEALALQHNGRLAEAESLYKKTLAIDKKNVQALNNLGVVYMSQDRSAHAVDAFRRAILLKKNYADPYYNLACIQAKWQNIGTALYYLKMAVSINHEVAEWARTDKDLANLHASPEFKSLIEKRGHE